VSEVDRTELYGGKVVVEFQPKGHKYTVFVNGVPTKPPSVTSITGIVDKSGPISGWAVNTTLQSIREQIHPHWQYTEGQLEDIYKIAKKAIYIKKQEAATIGTNAHDWLAEFFSGKNPPLPSPDADYRPSIDAALKWIEQHPVCFLTNEKPIYSLKHKFSGRMDGTALVDDQLTLVDFKTGNGIYDEAWLQTAAYNMALEEEHPDSIIDQRLVIRLGKLDGHFYSQIQPRKTLKPDWSGFLGAMKLHRRLAELKKLKKESDTSKSWLDEE
jgi:hypothetical protein